MASTAGGPCRPRLSPGLGGGTGPRTRSRQTGDGRDIVVEWRGRALRAVRRAHVLVARPRLVTRRPMPAIGDRGDLDRRRRGRWLNRNAVAAAPDDSRERRKKQQEHTETRQPAQRPVRSIEVSATHSNKNVTNQ